MSSRAPERQHTGMPRLPNFFVPGCQKSGTSYLCWQLSLHPDVFFPRTKEPMFFNRTDGSDAAFDSYLHDHFSDARDEQWIGEGSTLYLQVAAARHNILSRLGRDVRFIVCLRQHTEKVVSLYLHNFRMGRLRGDENITELEDTPFAVGKFTVCAEAVEHLIATFGEHNTKTMLYDDLLDNRDGFVREALSFLDLEMTAPPQPRLVNKGFPLVWDGDVLTVDPDAVTLKPGQVRPRFHKDDLYRLHQAFLPDVRRLADVTGRKLERWLDFPRFARPEIYALGRAKPSHVG